MEMYEKQPDNTFDAPNDYRNYLCHHGVKGMKWGVRKEYIPHPRKRRNKTNRIESSYDLKENGWKERDSVLKDSFSADKDYNKTGVSGHIIANRDTPNISIIAKNIDKINSEIDRLKKEFADVNYQYDKNDIPEGYPSDFAEKTRDAFRNMKEYIRVAYHDTRHYAPEYKIDKPDDLYEISMWSPVDDLEYVLPISQNEHGHFYIDPKAETEYR